MTSATVVASVGAPSGKDATGTGLKDRKSLRDNGVQIVVVSIVWAGGRTPGTWGRAWPGPPARMRRHACGWGHNPQAWRHFPSRPWRAMACTPRHAGVLVLVGALLLLTLSSPWGAVRWHARAAAGANSGAASPAALLCGGADTPAAAQRPSAQGGAAQDTRQPALPPWFQAALAWASSAREHQLVGFKLVLQCWGRPPLPSSWRA